MKNTVYFDNAATTFPKPECVMYEMYRCMREYCGNPGRGSNQMALKASEVLYDTRRALKEFFNATKEENVVFTFNATYALNMAIKCFVKKRSHVLISDIEHNAVYRPIVSEALRGNIKFDFFSTYDGNETSIISDISKKTKCNTSAIICTATSNICNLRLPIEQIGKYAKSRNLLFILDASQLAGHEKIDMQADNVSILCGPFHKGLYGPQGGGFMIVNDGVTNAHSTLIEGGSGVNSAEITMPRSLPEMFEAGTLSTPAAAGLARSIEYISDAGIENIARYESYISEGMRQTLLSFPDITLHGDYMRGGVFSVTSKKHTTEELSSLLDDAGIMVRAGLHCAPLAHKKLGTDKIGTVRFSIGMFNTENDINYLEYVLGKIFSKD